MRNDFSDSITHVLRTDDSRARHQRIQSAIGQKLEFEPRRRSDIQFIFAPSQPAAARLLRPQLRFHLAGDIPTYTLGDAYEPHPTANREIDGMTFPDMPWMLGDTGLSAEVRDSARQAFGESAARRGRLFAFGYDAYRIATSLQRGAPLNPQGLTGTLSLDERGRIRRELEWVQIRNGVPTPLDASSQRDSFAHSLSPHSTPDGWHGSPSDRLARREQRVGVSRGAGLFHRHAQFPAPRGRTRHRRPLG